MAPETEKNATNVDETFFIQVKKKAKADDGHIVSIGSKIISIEDGVVEVASKYKKEVDHLVSKGAIKIFKKATIETGSIKIM